MHLSYKYEFVNQVCTSSSFTGTCKTKNMQNLVMITSRLKFEPNWESVLILFVSWMCFLIKYIVFRTHWRKNNAKIVITIKFKILNLFKSNLGSILIFPVSNKKKKQINIIFPLRRKGLFYLIENMRNFFKNYIQNM